MKNAEAFAKIISYLSDNQIHTTSEIAEYCELSRKTVCIYLQFLSLEFDIQSFKGGKNHGGVQLISKRIKKVCNDEKQNKGGNNQIDISELSNTDKNLICEILEHYAKDNERIKSFTKNLRHKIAEGT